MLFILEKSKQKKKSSAIFVHSCKAGKEEYAETGNCTHNSSNISWISIYKTNYWWTMI